MLIIVRHGRTEANASGLLQGRVDNPLDETGQQQAHQIATALSNSDHRPDLIIASPLLRARQTAEATCELLGLDLTIDDRWAELDYGDWDGLPISEVSAETWQQWRSDPAFAPPGGESLAELNERVNAACDAITPEASEAHVAVFTHVSPIKAAVRWALGVDDELSWRMHVSQAQITNIGFRGTVPALRTFNDTSHLTS